MRDVTSSAEGSSLLSTVVVSTLGATLGGLVAALLIVAFTEMLKAMLAVVSRQNVGLVVLVPLLGLLLSVLILYRLGWGEEQSSQRPRWGGQVENLLVWRRALASDRRRGVICRR